jgi:SulP family sulfate permease
VDIVRIDGSLFFGAVEHVRDALERVRHERPEVKNLVIVTTAVNFVDVAGAELIAQVVREMRDTGVSVHVCGLKSDVRDVLERSGAIDAIGRDLVHESEDEALRSIGER